jgi:hypothetical protein
VPPRAHEILGWILFILSAVGFIVSSARMGDLAGMAGGVLFLAGCLVFVAPLLRRKG